jgi:hypothetical protein
MVAGFDVVPALLVPHDRRDRVGLDDQVPGHPPGLFGRLLGGGLVGITDGNQI